MTTADSTTDRELVNRLHRAEGQVRGVARMVEEGRPCVDILTQILAVEAALNQSAVALVDDHARHCLAAHENPDAVAELLAAVDLLARHRSH